MKFLYMDETYADPGLPLFARSVCLTGLLVPADRHRDIRTHFYDAVADATGRRPNAVPAVPEIHAANLLPGHDDDTRIRLLNALVDVIVGFDLGLYRVGYRRTPEMVDAFKTDIGILGMAFGGLLHLISAELETSAIWPVMEADRTNPQDRAFAGVVQFANHVDAHVGSSMQSHDFGNLGEVLYSTKRSVHGALVDCAAYMLKVRTIARLGIPLSDYKVRVAAAADRLVPAIRFDEVINMRWEAPPDGYRGSGPFRYSVAVTPSDEPG